MLNFLTRFIAVVIVVAVVIVISTSFWHIPRDIALIFAIVALASGIAMAIIGAIIRQGKPKLTEHIGRKEFYGVAVALFGWMQIWIINFSNRVDQIYQILAG